MFTDPKGELYDKTAGYLKKNGYEIKVLNLVNPQFSDGYNPLMHISSEIDVDVIASEDGVVIECVKVYLYGGGLLIAPRDVSAEVARYTEAQCRVIEGRR